jgi:hypothetical protein
MENIMTPKKLFKWKTYPDAWQWVKACIARFTSKNPEIGQVDLLLRQEAGVRLIDIVDHLVLPDSNALQYELGRLGYEQQEEFSNPEVWSHPGALLPRVVLGELKRARVGVAIKVDSLAEFLAAQGRCHTIEGSPYARLRKCEMSTRGQVSFWALERRTWRDGLVNAVVEPHGYLTRYLETLEGWRTRPRQQDADQVTLEGLIALGKRHVQAVGPDLAAHLFCETERWYWLSRSRVGQVQRRHQDAVGVGFSNHDHFTFRSSRRLFKELLEFFSVLGFEKREKFYAGEEAGWGAQVLEHPMIGVTLFVDVDLGAHELEIDFASQGLVQKSSLGTVGLWCALHGDSIFDSGLHHLAIRADFSALTRVLERSGVKMMEPFSTFPHLRQAFSRGEMWSVAQERIRNLEREGIISTKPSGKFIINGAVGSHLENIQREDGYKGFSQKQVSNIIQETNPEHYPAHEGV